MAKAKKANQLFIVLGDQLFPFAKTPLNNFTQVLMIEDYGLCTHYSYHKNKIIFFLSSMREYRDSLLKKKLQVTYLDADDKLFKKSYSAKLKDALDKMPQVTEVHHYRVADSFFAKDLEKAIKKSGRKQVIYENPMFLTSEAQFSDYLGSSKRPFMMNFYSMQRKRLDILMDKNGKPQGGKWSFDKENRKKYPKGIEIPGIPQFKEVANVTDVKKSVEKHFKKHPGTTENFWLPVNRKQALRWLDDFIEKKFNSFGPYEDAIKSDDTFGFHSVLSPMMNNGLLTPDEVVKRVIDKSKTLDVPLASVEGFVRQIIGWREFIKGIYDNYEARMMKENFWQSENRMADTWYSGETGIIPLDDSIHRAKKYGYVHHIERLMLQSNIMLLSEIHPHDVYAWFMEMYVDSADWVMAANVFGMGQMSEGGIFSTKPYVCGSNYIIKMSDYKKGDWCETLDGLYWRFIDKNKEVFAKNPRMSMMARMVEKMDKDRKKRLIMAADGFIAANTR